MTNQEELELATVEAQYWVDQKNALERLEKNEDFKMIILDGYFKDRAVDAVSLLSNPGIKKRGERPDIMEDLVAISGLQNHFMNVKNLGSVAEDDLDQEFGPSLED